MTEVRILTDPLGGSALTRAIQSARVPSAWLPARPDSPEAWRARALARLAEADWSSRWEALLPALAPEGAAAERLERVRRGGGVVVTTGQQPGLFGGPIYTWSKAMGALALADELQARTGIPTAVVYWAATDDADFAEAASTTVARPGGVEILRATQVPPVGTPMALAPLGDVREAVRRLAEACGSAPDARPLEAVRAAYASADVSHGEAFVHLLRQLLGPVGIPVLDASHPAVRAASDRTVRAALLHSRDVARALAARGREIRDAGHEPQVEDVEGLSLAFVRDATVKRRVMVDEAVPPDSVLTPNVLLRPIVEHAILPTVAYAAGPGELAYFAQVSAVAATLGVDAPLAVPRWSCTLIEPSVQALLDRFGVERKSLEQLDALEGRVARAALRPDTARVISELRDSIALLPDLLGEDSERLRVARAVAGAARSLQHRVDRMERRLIAAAKRLEVAQMRDIATLRAALYPRGSRQERMLNLIPILARHGTALLGEMAEAAGPHAMSLVEPSRSPLAAGASA
jgi:bacillithiol synthase